MSLDHAIAGGRPSSGSDGEGPPSASERVRAGRGRSWRYLALRLLQGLAVILAAIAVSFVLVNLTGSPANSLAGGFLSAEQLRELERELGYDRPLGERFVEYFGGALRGDFGESLRSREPALSLVFDALPYTAMLVATTIALALAIAVPVSVFSVLRRESRTDRVVRRSLFAMSGVPDFWLALMLAMVFAAWLHVLPSGGYGGPRSFVLPTLALALPLIPALVRLLRGEMLDIMGRDFIVALRARGLTEREVVLRHALRNAIPPTITFLALQVGWLLGGTLVVERIMGWPGIGSLAISATELRDLPVIQAIVVVVAAGYVVLNLIADLLVLWIDPRTRRSAA